MDFIRIQASLLSRTYSSPYLARRTLQVAADQGYTSLSSSASVNGGDTESLTETEDN